MSSGGGKPLLDRFRSSLSPDEPVLFTQVLEFMTWKSGHSSAELAPHKNDDVDFRTYLLYRRLGGATPGTLRTITTSVLRFYEWAFR